ncbi:uncharacterized protein LOC135833970 [Planococcus citri]|uniref:uncharacterized protein LOC135833970 n=1 Tax=Planococcus citri TaxID=170843 RepID=UPI0031F7A426
MFSLFWFVLVYLMDRLIHVKNEVQLSTPRGFYTTIRNLSDSSYVISTPSVPPKSLVSSSSYSISSQPALTITLADGNVLEAFRTMNFHRSKMNEYLCDDFITSAKITPIVGRILDSDTDNRNMETKLIRDVGSNSYKNWLMRTISNGNKPEQRNSSQRQDVLRSGYVEGHFKKPFYKVRGSNTRSDDDSHGNSNKYNNNVEDEDIYSGMSFPAYHVNRFKQTSYPIYQSTHNRSSIIPITLSTQQRRRYPTQLIPNENVIGVNLHGKFMNLTENYRKNHQTNVTPREPFQRSDPSQMNNLVQSLNKETVAIYVTQSSPPSMGQMITDGNTAYWTSDGNMEISSYNGWPGYSDGGDNMQRNPQIPAPETDNGGDSFGGYYYTTIPAPPMDGNNVPYTQNYPSITESPREYTYPPYYPPSDVGSGFNLPVYGYPGNNMDSTSTTAIPGLPQYTYQTPVTSNLYGYQPSITSWPYGWTPTVTTTTSMPMVIGWMPMTSPAPAPPMVNTLPPSSTTPPMMAMVPMMPMMPTPPPVTAAPTPPAPQTPVPMIPIYGYLPSVPASVPTPPNPYGYLPPKPPAGMWPSPTSTPLPYGIDYTFNPPNNQNPPYGPDMDFDPHSAAQFANSETQNDFPGDVSSLQDMPDMQVQDMSDLQMQDMQDLQDPRDNAISNILGPDAYELILTAIAFMAFGTYFMNMMLQLMQGNSPPTMMIIGNGGNNAVAPGSNEQFRKFSYEDDSRVIDDILFAINEFDNWLTKNSANSESN